MKGANLYKVAVEGVLLAVCVLLFFSCLSFDVADAPSQYVWPHNVPTANWCGVIGALFAYYLMYYVGPGIFIFLGASATMLVLNLSGVKLSQIALRLIGMVLMVVALSTCVYALKPYADSGFAIGNGGILGIATGTYLVKHIAVLGTSI
ncbi:MAG: DNA translocase FtsK 4TM domain-containing protein, partial [Anaerohalosphaera sp.]|nr:DNA translocase FtsK 4TM domain-containing protein [Anaerohalosphaera sp.]